MRAYRRLTEDDRIEIYAALKAGESQAAISRTLGFDKSTISRELRRNSGQRGYRAKQAQKFSQDRRMHVHHRRISKRQWRVVEAGLRQDWSPEQINGVMRLKGLAPVSHERIYQYIYADKRAGGTLHTHLRVQKKRRKRRGVFNRRGQIKDRIWISERPDIVETRARIGDWEVDTIVGHKEKAAMITLTERKSRLCRAVKVKDRTADTARRAIQKTLWPLRRTVYTLTYDNGPEFSRHQAINRALGSRSYFAHPYHSWERGANENMNGLLRQYFPKGQSMTQLTHRQIQNAVERLNNRPRKCLGYRTPYQVFKAETQTVALAS